MNDQARKRTIGLAAAIIVFAAAAFAIAAAGTPGQQSSGGGRAEIPTNYDNYFTFISDGIFPEQPPVLVGPDAMPYLRDQMKFSDARMAELRLDAVKVLRDRFGLDFSASDAAAGTQLMPYAINPALRYRAVSGGGANAPASGWEVRDGGWMVMVGPEGTTFYGTWGGPGGRAVPGGTSMVIGEYQIVRPEGVNSIHYQPIEPMIPGPDGAFRFVCELFSSQWGAGVANGTFQPRSLSGGRAQVAIRNVLTFPGYGHLGV